MTAEQVGAWVSMAKDRTLRDSLEAQVLPKAMQRRMEALRRKREGLSV